MSYTYTQPHSSFTANGSECSCARSFTSMLIIAGIALAVSVLFFHAAVILRLCLVVIVSVILSILIIPSIPQRRKR